MVSSDAAARLEKLRDVAALSFSSAGFSPVDPPIFASADTFLDRLGEEFRRQTCFFEDGSGEELCLRPEITIPVCRLALDQGFDGSEPLRLRYCGNVFRLRQGEAGGLIQSVQAGVELLGHAESAKAEAEIISLCASVLKAQGLGDCRIVLGDAGAFSELVAGLELSDRQRTYVKTLFDAHGSALSERLPPEATGPAPRSLDFDLALAQTESELELEGLTITGGRTSEDIARRLADRAGRRQAAAIPSGSRTALAEFFALKAPLDRAADAMAAFFDSVGVSSHAPSRLKALAETLAAAGMRCDRIGFDTSVHAPLGYYTGLEFRIETRGRAVAGGGRYDRLIGELASRPDWAVPAVGCALFLDDIMDVVS